MSATVVSRPTLQRMAERAFVDGKGKREKKRKTACQRVHMPLRHAGNAAPHLALARPQTPAARARGWAEAGGGETGDFVRRACNGPRAHVPWQAEARLRCVTRCSVRVAAMGVACTADRGVDVRHLLQNLSPRRRCETRRETGETKARCWAKGKGVDGRGAAHRRSGTHVRVWSREKFTVLGSRGASRESTPLKRMRSSPKAASSAASRCCRLCSMSCASCGSASVTSWQAWWGKAGPGKAGGVCLSRPWALHPTNASALSCTPLRFPVMQNNATPYLTKRSNHADIFRPWAEVPLLAGTGTVGHGWNTTRRPPVCFSLFLFFFFSSRLTCLPPKRKGRSGTLFSLPRLRAKSAPVRGP